MSNETINATVRFIEVGGQFIWKVYDEGGSVIAKAATMFASKEEAQADFEAFRSQAEQPVDPDLNQDGLPGPVQQEAAPEATTEAAPEQPVENQPAEVVDNPAETVETPEAVVAEPGTETAEEIANTTPAEGEVAGTAEGIAPAQVE